MILICLFVIFLKIFYVGYIMRDEVNWNMDEKNGCFYKKKIEHVE